MEMKQYIKPDAFLITANGGHRQAQKLGYRPHLAVGDFDSAPKPDTATAIIQLAKEKDDTDAHFSAKEALRRGFEDILFLGAAGGRLDHTFGVLQTLLYLSRRGATPWLAGENGFIYCVTEGALTLEKSASWVSVLAAGGTARGVTLEGLKYPLNNATLTTDFPIGVSNEFTDEKATVRCTEGSVYVMVVPQ